MKITDIIPDIMGKDLWVAVYGKYDYVYFVNFIGIRDGGRDIVFKYLTEGELLAHGRYLDPDSILFHMEHYASKRYLDDHFEVIEPLEIYTFDDLLETAQGAGEEEEDWEDEEE